MRIGRRRSLAVDKFVYEGRGRRTLPPLGGLSEGAVVHRPTTTVVVFVRGRWCSRARSRVWRLKLSTLATGVPLSPVSREKRSVLKWYSVPCSLQKKCGRFRSAAIDGVV